MFNVTPQSCFSPRADLDAVEKITVTEVKELPQE
jgi:hypothetical protein